jgi:hypothetical protein
VEEQEKVSERTLTDHDLLIELRADVRNLLNRLNGHVPESCMTHATEIAALKEAVAELRGRMWWMVGLAAAPTVGVIIYHVLGKGGP